MTRTLVGTGRGESVMDNRMDDRIEEIRKKIGVCDDIIIKQLVDRMECIQEIIAYKKKNGIPILQP